MTGISFIAVAHTHRCSILADPVLHSHKPIRIRPWEYVGHSYLHILSSGKRGRIRMLHRYIDRKMSMTLNIKRMFTCIMLYLLSSQKSRDPTSVPMYQPLKGAAVYSIPPQSNIMLDTPGTAYHSKPSSLNQS